LEEVRGDARSHPRDPDPSAEPALFVSPLDESLDAAGVAEVNVLEVQRLIVTFGE
jgi:hypothetical protein